MDNVVDLKHLRECQPSKKLKLDTKIDSANSELEATSLGSKLMEKKPEIRAILHDKYYRTLETVNVYTCGIMDKKQTSRLLREINEIYDLQELKHLKRIQKKNGELKIIITDKDNIVHEDASSSCTLDELFKETMMDTRGLSEPVITPVPKYPPLTRQQFNEWSKAWPCSFFENKYISKLLNNELFSANDLKDMKSYMKQAMDMAVLGKQRDMLPIGAVIVDPHTKKILCKAYDVSTQHPLQHTTMVCIDLIARLQGGGAWDLETDFPCDPLTSYKDNQDSCVSPNVCHASGKEYTRITEDSGGNQCILGSTSYLDKNDTGMAEESGCAKDGLPYLCTGYDMYVTREPCVMCSMALLHSRIRRVFYAQPCPSQGALGSKYKIHCLPETNHHFEVFAGLLETECDTMLGSDIK